MVPEGSVVVFLVDFFELQPRGSDDPQPDPSDPDPDLLFQV